MSGLTLFVVCLSVYLKRKDKSPKTRLEIGLCARVVGATSPLDLAEYSTIALTSS